MRLNQVAAQLYTVRDFLKTPPEIAAALRKVREIGYTAVQISGLGPIPVADLKQLLADTGLTCCATHEPSQQLLDEPERCIERLQELGCRQTAYPYPAGFDLNDPAQVTRLIHALDAAGAKFAAAGITLSYHNHHLEFVRSGGRIVLERIYAETHPRHLAGELDTYWVQFGGQDPATWCRKLQGRLACMHMKDYAIAKHPETGEFRPTFAEIGAGTLDWPGIISAAGASGCKWFIVEQDTCPGDPFDSLRQSFNYIKAHLCTT